MADLSPAVWWRLHQAMQQPSAPSGLLGSGAAPARLLSPDLAQAPSGSVPDVLQGAPTPFSFHPTGPSRIESRLMSPLAQAGLAIMAAGSPAGTTPNALAVGIEQGLAAAKGRRDRMAVQDWIDAVDQHFGSAPVPPHILEEAIQEGAASGNTLLMKTAQSALQNQMAQAKLTAENAPKAQITYDQNGNASWSVFDPSTLQQANVPLMTRDPESGKWTQLSRGPSSTSVSVSKLGWHDASEVELTGLPPGTQVFGGFVNTATGPKFSAATGAQGAPMVRAAPPAGAPSKADQQVTSAIGTSAYYAQRLTPEDFRALADPRAVAAGSWIGRNLLSLAPDYKQRVVLADHARKEFVNVYTTFLSGRVSAWRIKEVAAGLFPTSGDGKDVADEMYNRFEDLRKMEMAIYSNQIGTDEARKKLTGIVGSEVANGILDAIMKDHRPPPFAGVSPGGPSSSSPDIEGMQKVLGGSQ